jgi:tocopherol O-methyltransferase
MAASPHLMSGPATPCDSNRSAREAVRRYYDDCRNDYRILWRTDETGSIHFGYFDEADDERDLSIAAILQFLIQTTGGLAAALAAGLLAATGMEWGRQQAVRCLRFAARGRAQRHEAAQTRMTEVCARAVGLSSGERLLDAGCGVGGTDLWLASHFGVKVIGINVQPAHLDEARRTVVGCAARDLVTFSAQDFTQMAVLDEVIDVVWGLESICHCADKIDFMKEAHRVLRSGGRLMVADFFLRRDEMPPDQARRIGTWTDGWALPGLASIDGFHADLTAAGFRDVRFRDVGTNIRPSSERLYKASLIAQPISAALERIGARSAVQGRNVRASFEQYRAFRDGAWTYGIFVAVK